MGTAEVAAHESQLLAYGATGVTPIPESAFWEPPLRGPASYRLLWQVRGVTTLPVRWIVPALRRFGGESTVRASLKLYNTRGDIDALAASVDEFVHTRRSSGPRRSER